MESGLATRAYAASRSYWRLRPSDQGSQIRLGSLPHDLVSAIFFSTMPRYRPSFRSQRITSANGFKYKIATDTSSDAGPPLYPPPAYSRSAVSTRCLLLWNPDRSRPIKRTQYSQRPLVNAGLLRFPRAGHVQDFDLV